MGRLLRGDLVGALLLGVFVGYLGLEVGNLVTDAVDSAGVGSVEGSALGGEVGTADGSVEGSALGDEVGTADGSAEGSVLGDEVGKAVGSGVGGLMNEMYNSPFPDQTL